MFSVKEVTRCIEEFAPPAYQESYDNSGLQVGDLNAKVNSALLTLDVTESVIDEAISLGVKLIISHHPAIFGGLKRITPKTNAERAIIKAIKSDITIYSCHTNIDNVEKGVSYRMAEKLGLKDIKVLKPSTGNLFKLVTFVPHDHIEKVRTAIFEAGSGTIGKYDCCSYNIKGEGTFRASEGANPFTGGIGELHTEPETRVETIFPKHLESKIISALIKSHPYEEVAYDIYPLHNQNPTIGLGAIGILDKEEQETVFLESVKKTFQAGCVRHTALRNKPVKIVALCGGSGSFLLPDARNAGADIFISADFKYHQFFDAESQIVIADIGHFESEQFTLEIFYELLIKKLSNFAIYFSKVKNNPINYI
jgi:dinuclear metal center YbgI/SA1388 family protein